MRQQHTAPDAQKADKPRLLRGFLGVVGGRVFSNAITSQLNRKEEPHG